MDLSSQRLLVGKWLEEIFDQDEVPEFELNTQIIQQLYQMVLISRKNDKKTQLVIDDLNLKINEYNAEAHRLSEVLCRLGLGQIHLSKSCANNVMMLAKLGNLLNVKDSSDTCFYLALQHLDNELEKVIQQRKIEAKHVEQLSAKSYRAVLKYSSLKKALEDVQEKAEKEHQTNEERKNNTTFLLGKSEKYEKEINKLQRQLSKTLVDESVFHEKLVEKSEVLKSLQAKLSPLQAELQSYQSLPPDLTETKIRIEQLRKELATLEKDLLESLDVHCL
ncbi:HAUS augmin-like complex subunit 1 [Biomphalaria pfeifferi]|uniref:HAUS augmin-like complex subunit 1 n=1 Tax=Biomphalaria pfeifferi TaxID=112525 RepID=A0AAD8B8D5_BIOPF|nr:HAUS augmin-like complex subunit 1 [Biomphalaria pfeifferi]